MITAHGGDLRFLDPAFRYGPASRTELLTAAVEVRAPATTIENLLRIPDRRYNDMHDLHDELRAHHDGASW